jgi:hypothetical protein
MGKHRPSYESDSTASDFVYTDTTKPWNMLKSPTSYSLSVSTNEMTSVESIESTTYVSAATSISSVQPPAEVSAGPASTNASMFNSDT